MGLMEAFFDRSAEDIDCLTRPPVEGFQASMRRQSDAGAVPFLNRKKRHLRPHHNSGFVYGRAAMDPQAPRARSMPISKGPCYGAESHNARARRAFGASRQLGEALARRLVLLNSPRRPGIPGKSLKAASCASSEGGPCLEIWPFRWLRAAGGLICLLKSAMGGAVPLRDRRWRASVVMSMASIVGGPKSLKLPYGNLLSTRALKALRAGMTRSQKGVQGIQGRLLRPSCDLTWSYTHRLSALLHAH